MNALGLVGEAFRDRYAIQRLKDGGVLIDLATGTYSRLNLTAVEVCYALAEATDVAGAATLVAQRLGGNEDSARRAIDGVLEAFRRLGPRREPPEAFRYGPSPEGGYVLSSNGTPRLRSSADGTSIWLATTGDELTRRQLFEYLRAVAPKLLFLQSKLVIHGAASRILGGVRVFSGESGAGKTTTARAFNAAGAPLAAEDMLVVAKTSPLHVHEGGEAAINDWAARTADLLVHSCVERVDTSTLRIGGAGEPTPVKEIWFLDAARRDQHGGPIAPHRLGQTEGALSVMTSLFLGAASPEGWRLFLSLAAQVASDVPLFEALMPAGLDALSAAARIYAENSAS